MSSVLVVMVLLINAQCVYIDLLTLLYHFFFSHWPVFAGDTVKKTFKVERVRNTSDGHHSVSDALP